jgi:hypothetical protein
MSNGFGPTNPEGGYYWRAMPADEVTIFNDLTKLYGRAAGMAPTGLAELNGLPTMKKRRCARFFWEKGKAIAWAKSVGTGAKVLGVPKEPLVQGTDYDIWPKTTDVYITGAAARAHGKLYDPGAVP